MKPDGFISTSKIWWRPLPFTRRWRRVFAANNMCRKCTTCQMSNVCCALCNVVVKTPDDLLARRTFDKLWQAERLMSEGFYGKSRGREDRTRGSFAGRIFRTAFAAHDGGLGIGTAGWIGAVVRPDSARACGPSDSRDRCFHDRLLDHRAHRPRHNGHDRVFPVLGPPHCGL